MITVNGEYDADFYVLLFVVAPVALLGMVGNIVCLIILKRNSYNVATVKLLQAIVIANTLYIAFVVASRLHEILSATMNNMPDIVTVGIEAYVKVAFIPLCHTIIVYLIVLVTLDRYTTVFKPCGIAYLCHGNTAIFRVIFAIVGLAVIVNLPHFFEMHISVTECTPGNASLMHDTSPSPSMSELVSNTAAVDTIDEEQLNNEIHADVNKSFEASMDEAAKSEIDPEIDMDEDFDDPLQRCKSVTNQSDDDAFGAFDGIQPYPSDFVNTPVHHAYRVFELLATELVPVVLIIVMNARLICVMQHLMIRRAQSIHAQRRSEYRAVLVTLVILVSVFIVCEMPMFLLKLAELVEKLFDTSRRSRTIYVVFYSVSQLFVQISASSNFIVYFCSNPVHRQQLWALLRCNCGHSKKQGCAYACVCAIDSDSQIRTPDGSITERQPPFGQTSTPMPPPHLQVHLQPPKPQQVIVTLASPAWKRWWQLLRPREGITTSVEAESVYSRIRTQRMLYNQYFRDTQLPSPPRRGCYLSPESANITANRHAYQVRFQPAFCV